MKIIVVLLVNLWLAIQSSVLQGAVFFTSSPSSWIGQGVTYTSEHMGIKDSTIYPPPNDISYISASFAYFVVDFVGLNRHELLTTGVYQDTLRIPFNGSNPGLNLTAPGRVNNVLSGWFEIFELEREGNVITSAAIDFMQYDGQCKDKWNFGSLRYNSSYPLTVAVPEPNSIFSLSLLFLFFACWRLWRFCH